MPYTQTFQDNFNGVAGTALEAHTPDLGTSWTKDYFTGTGGFKIFTGGTSVQPNNGGFPLYVSNGNSYYKDSNSAFLDGYVEANLSSIGVSDAYWLFLRYINSTTWYGLRITNIATSIYRNGVLVGIVGGSGTLFKLQVLNDTVTSYVGGVLQDTYIDGSPLASGAGGLGYTGSLVGTSSAILDYTTYTYSSPSPILAKSYVTGGIAPLFGGFKYVTGGVYLSPIIVQQDVDEFQVIADQQAVKFYWKDQNNNSRRTYSLYESSDNGKTWTLVNTTNQLSYE